MTTLATDVFIPRPIPVPSAVADIHKIAAKVRKSDHKAKLTTLVFIASMAVIAIISVTKLVWNGQGTTSLSLEDGVNVVRDEWASTPIRVSAAYRLALIAESAVSALADVERSNDVELASKAKIWRSRVRDAINAR